MPDKLNAGQAPWHRWSTRRWNRTAAAPSVGNGSGSDASSSQDVCKRVEATLQRQMLAPILGLIRCLRGSPAVASAA